MVEGSTGVQQEADDIHQLLDNGLGRRKDKMMMGVRKRKNACLLCQEWNGNRQLNLLRNGVVND
jgi:hypothetical protein